MWGAAISSQAGNDQVEWPLRDIIADTKVSRTLNGSNSTSGLAELMARAGHVSPRAAMIYQHSIPERDQLIAERLGGIASTHGGAEEPPPSDSEIAHGTQSVLDVPEGFWPLDWDDDWSG